MIQKEEKYCSKCGRLLPVSEYYTHPARGNKGKPYLYAECKDCFRQRQLKYHYSHREQRLQYIREYQKIKI